MNQPLCWPLGADVLTKIKSYEAGPDGTGPALKAYKCPAGVWTLGWGATGAGVGPGIVWTIQQAELRFERDLWDMSMGVTQLLGNSPCTILQFEALVSFAYNVGLDMDVDPTAEGLGDSTLLKKHLQGDFEGAAKEFLKWNKARVKGKVVILRGLTTRREWEANHYRGGRST